MADGEKKANLSDASRALRYGISRKAAALNETVVLPQTGDRWRPLPETGGLELVDRQGRSRGWCYVPKAWALGEDEESGK
jgi:hypothetical protein